MTSIPKWFYAVLIIPRLLLFVASLQHPEVAVKTDSRQYIALAQNFVNHGVYSTAATPPFQPETMRTPGYPAFLILFYALFASPVPWILAIQLVISAATCLIFWRWTHPWSGRRGAMAAALIAGCDWVMLAHTTMVLTETLFIFFFTLALMKTWDALGHPGRGTTWAGLWWGLAILVRPVALYLPFLLSVLWWKQKRWAAIFLLTSYFLPGLWMVRNYRATGYFGYTSIDGVALLYYPAAGAEAIRTKEPIDAVRLRLRGEAEAGLAPNATDVEIRHAYKKKADEAMRRSMWNLILFHMHGAIRILGGTGLEMLTDLMGLQAPAPPGSSAALIQGFGTRHLLKSFPLLWPVIIFYIFALLWAYGTFARGLVHLWFQKSYLRVFLLAGAFLYILAISSHQGYYRFRIPLIPIMAIGVAAYFAGRVPHERKAFLS